MSESKIIIGVDEVGKGALAGPLVIAAAAFVRGAAPVTAVFKGLRSDKQLMVGDSKSFTNPAHREVLAAAVGVSAAATGVIERSNKEIDERLMFNIFPEALKLCISRIVESLRATHHGAEPDDFLVLIDGDIYVPSGIPCPWRTIIDGDKLVWQIGAASLLAKVHRDTKMLLLHEQHPKYQFDKNKGYPVPAHKTLLKKHGPSPVHRRSYKPVAEWNGVPEGFEA